MTNTVNVPKFLKHLSTYESSLSPIELFDNAKLNSSICNKQKKLRNKLPFLRAAF